MTNIKYYKSVLEMRYTLQATLTLLLKAFWGVAMAVFLLVGCTADDQVKLDGKIKGAEGKMLYLSKIGLNGKQTIDSVKIKGNEKFGFKVEIPEFPEFYYVQLDSMSGLTILVDTVNHIQIRSTVSHFGEKAVIEGSPSSQLLHNALLAVKNERKNYLNFVKTYNDLPLGEERDELMGAYADRLKLFKDSIGGELLKNTWSMSSYYVLYQKLSDSFLLFDPNIKSDYTYFGAVATGLNLKYPDDPRVKAFYKMTLGALKKQRAAKMQKLIDEAEFGIPQIELPNLAGDTISLSELKGKVVVLNFWGAQSQASRIWNKTLKKAYSTYNNSGLEIYQVSLDKSKILWEKAMRDDGINWISVGDYGEGSTRAAMSYNVKKVPTTFVVDQNGDITGKFEDEKSLMAELNRLL